MGICLSIGERPAKEDIVVAVPERSGSDDALGPSASHCRQTASRDSHRRVRPSKVTDTSPGNSLTEACRRTDDPYRATTFRETPQCSSICAYVENQPERKAVVRASTGGEPSPPCRARPSGAAGPQSRAHRFSCSGKPPSQRMLDVPPAKKDWTVVPDDFRHLANLDPFERSMLHRGSRRAETPRQSRATGPRSLREATPSTTRNAGDPSDKGDTDSVGVGVSVSVRPPLAALPPGHVVLGAETPAKSENASVACPRRQLGRDVASTVGVASRSTLAVSSGALMPARSTPGQGSLVEGVNESAIALEMKLSSKVRHRTAIVPQAVNPFLKYEE
ncbi:unnamed protein product [Pedinophyceae sp. YPF-701]|nr:unnamed protein product [Pedinophyceae sp. YPF-701]